VYVPRGHSRWRRRPLLVLLHGCRQTPEDIASGTRITDLADERDWVVLLPRQKKDANAWGCWNWFDQRTAAGQGEAAIVAAQVRAVRRLYGVHPRRTFVVGMSSGACLAAVLGLHFGKLFAAVGLHSGCACGAASSPATALKTLATGADTDIVAIALRARAQASSRARLLPTCIIHGERDDVVALRNAVDAGRQFLAFNGYPPDALRAPDGLPVADTTSTTALPGGGAMTTDDYRAGGRVVVRLVRVAELGHAWSGGNAAFAYNDPRPPDATSLFGAFFAQHPGPG
jgi:poly(hydroxyalkanoate) depolymerase family esterase